MPVRLPWLRPALLAAAVLAMALPTVALAQSDEEQRLSDAERRIEELGDELSSARGDADAARSELRAAQRRLDEVEEIVNQVARAVERQEVDVAEAAEELERVEREAEDVREAFEGRVATMFKQGSGSQYEVLFASEGVRDALDRSSLLASITDADQATLEELDVAEVAVEAQRQRFEAEKERLEQRQVEQERLLERVAEIRDTRAARAAAAEREVEGLKAEREDLRSDRKRLEKLIEERQSAPASIGTPSRSGYIWPTCGPVTSEYGYRWGRRHEGLDIGAATGAGIVAAKDGQVISASYQGGYGNLTLIDHGDGVVTAYAHQRSMEVSEGQSVSQGQRIGAVGSTGNVTGSHLHFETRANGSATNPRGYLSGSPC